MQPERKIFSVRLRAAPPAKNSMQPEFLFWLGVCLALSSLATRKLLVLSISAKDELRLIRWALIPFNSTLNSRWTSLGPQPMPSSGIGSRPGFEVEFEVPGELPSTLQAQRLELQQFTVCSLLSSRATPSNTSVCCRYRHGISSSADYPSQIRCLNFGIAGSEPCWDSQLARNLSANLNQA